VSNERFKHLLSPYTIRRFTFKNRILAAPFGTLHKNPNGYLDRDCLDWYQNIIDGGVARISTIDYPVDKVYAGKGSQARRPPFWKDPSDDAFVEHFEEFNHYAHARDCITMVDFHHNGQKAGPEPGYWDDFYADAALSPTPGVSEYGFAGIHGLGGKPYKVMDEELIEKVANDFVRVCLKAKEVGFDGAVIHGAHGNLFCQFLCRNNNRTDKWGGSLKNRMNFPLYVISKMRQAVGDDFLLEIRMSAKSSIPSQIIPESEAIEYGIAMDGLADIIHVTTNDGVISTCRYPEGLNVGVAAEIKKHVKVSAVGVVGGMNDPDLCERVIAGGMVDFVITGRQLHFADPNWPKKLIDGRPELINNCLRCSVGCTGEYLCHVNPVKQMRIPAELKIKKAKKSKKIVIIGGGIAGMKAAETAVLCGHKPIIIERGKALGGIMFFADWDKIKHETQIYKNSMIKRMETLGVEVRLGITATPEMIKAENADAVIVAVGAEQLWPDIPGIRSKLVMNAMGTYSTFNNYGENVVVVGGGLTGVETALHLSQTGRYLTIVEKANRVLPAHLHDPDEMVNNIKDHAGGHSAYSEFIERIEATGIKMLVSHTVSAIGEASVTAVDRYGTEAILPASKVIIAVGVKERRELAESFRGTAPLFYKVGDCYKPGNIRDAVYFAYNAVMDVAE
jgi:2,4-dienoyl-CoA reductase-like NADH-dependent reductase (Old Yellow Enzyme family)/thioredoxin reductase